MFIWWALLTCFLLESSVLLTYWQKGQTYLASMWFTSTCNLIFALFLSTFAHTLHIQPRPFTLSRYWLYRSPSARIGRAVELIRWMECNHYKGCWEHAQNLNIILVNINSVCLNDVSNARNMVSGPQVITKVVPQLETFEADAAFDQPRRLRTVHISVVFLGTDRSGKLFLTTLAASRSIL